MKTNVVFYRLSGDYITIMCAVDNLNLVINIV